MKHILSSYGFSSCLLNFGNNKVFYSYTDCICISDINVFFFHLAERPYAEEKR